MRFGGLERLRRRARRSAGVRGCRACAAAYASADDLTTLADVETFTLGKRTGESILRATSTYSASPTLSVQAGLEGDYNWLTGRTRETDPGLPIAVPAANVHVTELRGEAFADATWQAGPDLTVEIGARVEASEIASTGDVVATERLALRARKTFG